ncbi:MAG: PKD domain-containing protein, partial [Lewinella sp.]|nr:PKD domain-containing protein [Lewinella sp.]
TFLDLTSITSWSWDFGDPASGVDNTSTNKDPAHVFSSDGTFTVTLTVTTAEGCSASVSRAVSLYPQPSVAIPDPTATCATTALGFTADVAPTVATVKWNFGDPASGDADTSTLFNSFHAFAMPGNYTVGLEATSIYGCTNVSTRTISVTPNLLAGDIAPPGTSTLCTGDSLLLTAPGMAPVEWLWSTGDTTQTLMVRDAGVYAVTLTDPDGCTYAPAPSSIDLIPAPSSPIRAVTYDAFNQPTSFAYDTLYVCEGIDVYLETPQQTDYSYSWSSGDVDNTTEFSELRNNLLPAGIHTVSLTVTDNTTGCSAVEVFVVIVHPNPDVPVLDDGNNGPVCAGTTTTISVTNPAADVTYVWSNGDTGASITTAEAGIYSVRAINTFGCASESETTEILAGPDIDLVPSGCHARCSPDTLCLPTIPNVVSYQWYQDGSPIPAPEGTIPELVVTESGSYTLEMEDTDGCVQTSEPLVLELFESFGSLSGVVYYDLNENAVVDMPDSLAGDIIFQLSDDTGIIAQDTTGINGTYHFVNIPGGEYTICIDTLNLPNGWWPYEICRDVTVDGCGESGIGDPLEWLLYPYCPVQETYLTEEICPNAIFDYNGDQLGIGDYSYTFTDENGCDSTVYLSLLPLPPYTSDVTLMGCPGETVTFGGETLAVGTVTQVTLIENDGCENIVTVTVDAYPVSTTAETVYVCPGETYAYNGEELAAGTVNNYIFPDVNGCDSTVVITVEEYQVNEGTETRYACAGETVSFMGQEIPAGTSMTFNLVSSLGCDSTTTLTVIELPSSSSELSVSICPEETYTFAGQAYPPGTDQVFTLTNSAGCDSLVHLLVMAEAAAEYELTVTESCLGLGTGQLTVMPVSGAQPFTYALDGDTFQSTGMFGNLPAGAHQLTVEDATGCQYSETVQVAALPALTVDLQDEILPCDSSSITLAAQVLSGDDGQLQFLWDNGLTTPTRPVAATGSYSVQVSNGCELQDIKVEVTSELGDELSLVYLPNAFSPNDDGTNDFFQGYFNQDVNATSFVLQVFDRWGGLLWETDDPTAGWNGKVRGQPAPPAVYIWRLEAEVDVCGRLESLKREGDMVLLR